MIRVRKPNVRIDSPDYGELCSVASELGLDNIDVISVGLRAIARLDPDILAHVVEARRREKRSRDGRRMNRRGGHQGATHA